MLVFCFYEKHLFSESTNSYKILTFILLLKYVFNVRKYQINRMIDMNQTNIFENLITHLIIEAQNTHCIIV